MPLTKPFINTISAFDATKGSDIIVNVLGGDLITSITMYIYDEMQKLVYSNTKEFTDKKTDNIRNFTINIKSKLLVNSFNYLINVQTHNDKENSPYSSSAIISCYQEPKFLMKYKNTNIESENYKDFKDNVILNNENFNLYLDFNKTNPNSQAKLNYLWVEVYGIKNNIQNKIYKSNNVYVKTTGEEYYDVSISNLYPTNGENKVYDNYKFVINGMTTEFMEFKNIVQNVKVEYSISEEFSYFNLYNNDKKGYVEINVDLSELFNNVSSIARIDIKRRTLFVNETSDWIILQSIYSYNNNNNNKFSIYDTYCANNTLYEYKISIYDNNGNENYPLTKQVLSKFYNNYICDYQYLFNISLENSIDSSQVIQKSAIYEPYGSKYPFVAYNADTQYESGQMSTILLIDNEQHIDRKGQIELKKDFNNFLNNKMTKILKDVNGNIMIITVYDNIENNYFKELGNGICSTTFKYVEVGEFEEESMNKLGLLGKFEMHYIE